MLVVWCCSMFSFVLSQNSVKPSDELIDIRTNNQHTDSIWCLATSSDGRFLYSGSRDHTIRVWLVESGRCTSILRGNSACLLSTRLLARICFRPREPDLSRRSRTWISDIMLKRLYVQVFYSFAVFGNRSTILVRVWDVEKSFQETRCLTHAAEVQCVK